MTATGSLGARHIVVLDEGTTSTRAIAFERDDLESIAAVRQEPLETSYPKGGWVEQDAEEIWDKSLAAARGVIEEVGGAGAVAALGITNQRETTVVWDARDGRPVAPAIVWQDRRTEARCRALSDAGHGDAVRRATGLEIDPYFSATKIEWLLEHVDGARDDARAGHLRFGTIDSWLLWKLTGGAVHATDATNASRTLLRDLDAQTDAPWNAELAALFGVPLSMLPNVGPSQHHFGDALAEHFGAPLPILSMVGDQQSALFGHGCLDAGRAKITFGTGAFLVTNTGTSPSSSANRLLATVGYSLEGGARAYALEGSIFNAGTVVQWMRDELGLLASAADSEALARSVPDSGGVVFVPAFTGLGAPHWDAEARGAIFGLTRATRPAHIVRAGLESLCFQTDELLSAMAEDGAAAKELRVDGGMVRNGWLMQRLADVTGLPIVRPEFNEMTALGAAALAAIGLGWTTAEAWGAREPAADRFEPSIPADERERLRAAWARAVGRVRS